MMDGTEQLLSTEITKSCQLGKPLGLGPSAYWKCSGNRPGGPAADGFALSIPRPASAPSQEFTLFHGFALRLKQPGLTVTRKLQSSAWPNYEIEDQFPVTAIHYLDKELPFDLKLESFSPFTPMNEQESNLPVLICSCQVTNLSSSPMDIDLLCWLQPGQKADNKVMVLQKKWRGIQQVHSNSNTSFQHCLSALRNDARLFPHFEEDSWEDYFELPGAECTANDTPGIAVCSSIQILPGQHATCHFAISWWDPAPGLLLPNPATFTSATDVMAYVSDQLSKLIYQTMLWKKNWVDSSLPSWLLEQTFTLEQYQHDLTGNVSEGETGMETVAISPAVARLYPNTAKSFVQLYELPSVLPTHQKDHDSPSFTVVKLQALSILHTYRAHQLSEDMQFLRVNWAQLTQVIQFMLHHAEALYNATGEQGQKLEEVLWLCITAAKSAYQMAMEMDSHSLADRCMQFISPIEKKISANYKFEQEQEAFQYLCKYLAAKNWSQQLNLGQLSNQSPPDNQRLELSGFILRKLTDNSLPVNYETIEQWAAHLMSEDQYQESLLLLKRYAALRSQCGQVKNILVQSSPIINSCNSYNTFLAACGFSYHGPRGFIRFAPITSQDNFKAPFLVANGWGSYKQQKKHRKQVHELYIKYGHLKVQTLSFDVEQPGNIHIATVALEGKKVPAKLTKEGNSVFISIKPTQVIANQSLTITLT